MSYPLICCEAIVDLNWRERSSWILSVALVIFWPTVNALAQSPIAAGSTSSASGGTRVPVYSELTKLLEQGGLPESIEHLQLLERQQRLVAKTAVPSTVSVKIGPAQGCGVIITGSGFVLTAAHVAMRPNKTAVITLSDGRNVMATTLGMNRNVDAGLIKINDGQNGGQPWPHATLGTSDNLVAGMWCIATGHPGGYDQVRGPVTRVGRILAVRPGSIVTDCALIGGDSGGPLFDIAGRLIAVHSRIGNDVADNLHIQIDHYDYSWDRLANREAWGFLPGFKPVLGVKRAADTRRAKVGIVHRGSAAADAGIQSGDIIEQFGDQPIASFDSLKAAVADTMPGERVKVWVNRQGQRIGITVEIGREED
ncbi:MAG: trypsin-like peptidase domain-containing protein [Pirellulaceae bacterium]